MELKRATGEIAPESARMASAPVSAIRTPLSPNILKKEDSFIAKLIMN
jgi:hypothetical protein